MARIPSSIPVEKTDKGTETVPAFALPKEEIAIADFWVGVVLIVHKTLWKNKHISNLEALVVKHIFGVNKSNFKATIHKEQEFSSARVGVRWVQTIGRVLKHSILHTLPVESWELIHGCFC